MKVERLTKGEWGKTRAFVDVRTDEGFIIKGFRLVLHNGEYFVGMPSKREKDGEYYDTVIADRDLKDKLKELVMAEYGGAAVQDPGFEPGPPPPGDLPF